MLRKHKFWLRKPISIEKTEVFVGKTTFVQKAVLLNYSMAP